MNKLSYKYKVVRTYGCSFIKPTSELETAFEEGWQYVSCHEIDGLLEYILCKEVADE